MNYVLLFVAKFLRMIFFPIGTVFTLVVAFKRGSWRKAEGYLSNAAITRALSIDQEGNVVCRDLMNWALIEGENKYEFGNYRETISSVLGKNKARGTLRRPGRILADLLNAIDPEHVERAAANSLIP